MECLSGWEYKVVDLIAEIRKRGVKLEVPGQWLHTADLEKVLDELGAQGWELIATHFLLDEPEVVIVGFFKRPRQ